MDNKGEFLSKLKGWVGGSGSENKPEISDQDERQQVLEKFRLMGATGSEGQAPVASYGEGSTVILTDFPKGTILREKFINDDMPGEENYVFWYVGGIDDKTGKFKLFDHNHPRLNRTLPYIVNAPKAGCLKREFEVDKAKRLEFEVGQPGTMLDLSFRRHPAEWFNQMYKKRSSLTVDVMEFGKRVKQDVKEKQRQPLGQLVPAPESQSI